MDLEKLTWRIDLVDNTQSSETPILPLEEDPYISLEAALEGLRSEMEVLSQQRGDSWGVISERINEHIDTAVHLAASRLGMEPAPTGTL